MTLPFPKLSPRIKQRVSDLNAMCVVAFISGLISLFSGGLFTPVGFFASIFALTGREDPEGLNKVLAVTGLVLSLVPVLLTVLLVWAFLFAIPIAIVELG